MHVTDERLDQLSHRFEEVIMMIDDIGFWAIFFLISVIGVAVGLPILDEILLPSQGEVVVTTGYLEEGWEAVGLGEIARITGIEPAGQEYMLGGRLFQDCVIAYTITSYPEVVGRDGEGLPLLLLNGQQVYASVIEDSVRKDRCEFHD